MCTDYLTIPEITVTYKDQVKAADRAAVYGAANSFEIFQPIYEDFVQHHEELWVMYLNQANKVLGVSQISKCGLTCTLADIRIIMQTALKANCVSIILSHNHPSGNKQPSPDDKRLTQKVKQACELLDLRLLDHIIVTAEGYYSFADEGLL